MTLLSTHLNTMNIPNMPNITCPNAKRVVPRKYTSKPNTRHY